MPTDAEIDAAQAYEDLHVPALFGQWAPVVVGAAGIGPGDRVLDVACGTGIVAREAARRAGRTGRVIGADVDPGMLAVAAQLAPDVSWQEASAARLPFDDDSFDAVLCQFGLMFFPDRGAALREMLRVLDSGGTFVATVWDALERSPAYAIVVPLLERLAGSRAAQALEAPFVMGNAAELEELVRAAGGNDVAVTTRSGVARFPSVRTMVEADLRGWLPVMGVNLAEASIDAILEAAEASLHPYVKADGTVEFESSAHIVTATA